VATVTKDDISPDESLMTKDRLIVVVVGDITAGRVKAQAG